MADIAELGIKIKADDIRDAVKELDHLENQSKKTEKATDDLEQSTKRATTAYLSIGAAIVGVTLGIQKIFSATIEQEQALAQLESTLISTNGAVGLTSKELQQMASALQNTSTYGDEAIMSMQAVLLTFTKIGKETFPQATQAILDMSVRLGMDLKSSAIQVGKALNDPVQGISAMTRAGVQFTESQKDMVKSLVESGDMIGAQTIILKELETQFGGAAKAARDTLGGALAGLSNAFGDLFESDAKGVKGATKAINDFSAVLADPGIKESALRITSAIIDGFGTAGKLVLTLGIRIEDLGDTLGAYAAAAASVFSGEFEQAKAIIALREEELKKSDEKIAKIWEEKKATDELNISKSEDQATTTIAMSGVTVVGTPEEDPAKKMQEQIDLKQQFEDLITQIDRDAADQRIEIYQAEHQARVDAANDALTNLSSLMISKNKQMFEVGKAAAIAQTIISTYSSAQKSYDALASIPYVGPALGAAAAAAAIAAGLARVNAIKSQSMTAGGGVSAAGSSGGVTVGGGMPTIAEPPPDRSKDKTSKELRITVEGDGPHSEGMRKFAENLAETLRDMGSDTQLVLS